MDRAFQLKEHLDIVAALTEINSRRLLTMGRRGGEAIELARAIEDRAAAGAGPAEDARIEALSHRLAATEAELEAMDREGGRLNVALARAFGDDSSGTDET
ncbi:MAG: hypothetical protein JWO83_1512 [Caulobacteraceae bacterium]|jgi:hypothetical protein|nr:hypothetical protein [Caulobacteraceae bacterium]